MYEWEPLLRWAALRRTLRERLWANVPLILQREILRVWRGFAAPVCSARRRRVDAEACGACEGAVSFRADRHGVRIAQCFCRSWRSARLAHALTGAGAALELPRANHLISAARSAQRSPVAICLCASLNPSA